MNNNYMVSALLLLLFAVLGVFVYYVTSVGGQCLIDPLGYAVDAIEEANDAALTCSCSFDKSNSPSLVLDNDGLRVKRFSRDPLAGLSSELLSSLNTSSPSSS